MNIYRLSIGYMAHYVAADSEEHAKQQGSDPIRFPGMSYLPFNVELVQVPDHTIEAVRVSNELEEMTRDQLIQLLKDKDIKHHHNLKDDKLRELLLNHVA